MCKKKCKCLKYKFSKGTYPKKYKVIVYRGDKKIKTTQFGDQRYGQYQDRTPLKLYKHKDTLDNVVVRARTTTEREGRWGCTSGNI